MYPISEQISQALLTTLAGVSTTAGYQTTLRPSGPRPSPPPSKLLAILYEGEDEEAGNGDGTGSAPIGKVGWKRPYAVLIWGGGSETDTTPYDTLLNCARADVEKALSADPSVGGLARNLTIKAPGKIESDNEPAAIIVNFDVTYWTVWNNPFTQ